MSHDSSNTKCQEMKARAETWSRTAFHLIFGYIIFTIFFCVARFTSLGDENLLNVDCNGVTIGGEILDTCIPLFVFYSCYIIFRRVAFILFRYPLVKRIETIIRKFLDDFVLMFYVCFVPFLCFYARELYDSYARHAIWCFANLPITISTLTIHIFFDYGLQLSLRLIPLLLLLYVISVIYKAVKFSREANSPIENANSDKALSSRKSLREIIRGRTVIVLKDFFGWVAIFIFWTALFILIVGIFLKVYSLLETPTIVSNETSSMASMGGAFIDDFIDSLILFIICAIFFNALIRNIIFGIWECVILVFPRFTKWADFYSKTQDRPWFPIILWGSVVFCFFVSIFLIYIIATINISLGQP